MKNYFSLTILLFFSIVLSISTVFIFIIKPSLNQECGSNIVAGGHSQIGGHFELTTTNNQTVSSRDLISRPSLIYFGYSYCPDVCPYDLQRNMIAIDILDSLGIDIIPIFITIDPSRDTVERLKEFTSFVHPKLIGLTGSEDEVKHVMSLFKVYGKKSNNSDLNSDEYLMDHSSFTYLVNSSGKLLEYFNRKISGEEMANKISCYLEG